MTSRENYTRSTIRKVSFCAVVFVSGACAKAQTIEIDPRDGRAKIELKSDWLPTVAQISRVESLLKMPPEVGKLQEYDRYWMGRVENGRKLISGHLEIWRSPSPGRQPGSRHIVKHQFLEIVHDGGCGTVSISYDLQTDRILKHTCGADMRGPQGPHGWRYK